MMFTVAEIHERDRARAFVALAAADDALVSAHQLVGSLARMVGNRAEPRWSDADATRAVACIERALAEVKAAAVRTGSMPDIDEEAAA